MTAIKTAFMNKYFKIIAIDQDQHVIPLSFTLRPSLTIKWFEMLILFNKNIFNEYVY